MNDNELNIKLKELANSALENYFVNNYNEAVIDLKAAEMIDPENPEILHNLAVCYARMGLHKTAIEYCERLLSTEKGYIDSAAVKKMLAFSLISTDSQGRALSLIEEVIAYSPRDESALAMKGYCLERSGKAAEAIKVYRLILTINPANYSAMNSIAYLTVKTGGDLKEAMAMISAAVRAKPANGAYLDTMGCILMKSGDFKRAEAAFNKALKLLPAEKEIIANIDKLKKTRK